VAQLALIDLGLIGQEQAAEPVSREGWRAAHRAWLAVVTAALLLCTVAAAGTPPRPELSEVRVPAGLGHDARVIGERLYVVTRDPSAPNATARTVSAYRLPDGAALWRAPLPLLGGSRWMVAATGALLIASETDEGPVTVALDDATGLLLWRREALPLGAAGDGALALLRRPAAGQTWQDLGVQVIEAVQARTGRGAWSYPLPEAGQVALAEGGGRLTRTVTGVPSGRVDVRDLATGRLIASRQVLPPPTPGRVSRFQTWLQVAGDLVLVGEPGEPTSAYELDTLRPRWTSDLDLSTVFVSATCGPVLCAFGRGGGVRALDVSTGRLRWSSQRLTYARSYAHVLVALAERPDRSEPPVLEVVDARTGYPMRDLGPWRLTAGTGAPPLAIRHDAASMRAWVGTLDPDVRAVRPLGVLPDIVDGCEAGSGWVMCRHLDASIGLWRFG
jgi:outer membrane protein assembly factor BamB